MHHYAHGVQQQKIKQHDLSWQSQRHPFPHSSRTSASNSWICLVAQRPPANTRSHFFATALFPQQQLVFFLWGGYGLSGIVLGHGRCTCGPKVAPKVALLGARCMPAMPCGLCASIPPAAINSSNLPHQSSWLISNRIELDSFFTFARPRGAKQRLRLYPMLNEQNLIRIIPA